MNIFVLDHSPKTSAEMMCDKHVVKMILETAQMLCTVAHNNGHVAPYKAAFKNHPCTLWVGKTRQNWDWLIEHDHHVDVQLFTDSSAAKSTVMKRGSGRMKHMEIRYLAVQECTRMDKARSFEHPESGHK